MKTQAIDVDQKHQRHARRRTCQLKVQREISPQGRNLLVFSAIKPPAIGLPMTLALFEGMNLSELTQRQDREVEQDCRC